MGDFDSDHIRNLAFMGHSGSGKSTLVEALLNRTGAVSGDSNHSRRGRVTDHSEQEQQAGHSLESSILVLPLFQWVLLND